MPNVRGNDAIVKVFAANGTELTTINATSQNDDEQSNPVVSVLAEGRFIVAWTERTARPGDSDASVRAQMFNANGTRSGAEFLVNTTTTGWQFGPARTTLADGRVFIRWTDFSGTGDDTSGTAIRAPIFDPREAAVLLWGTADGDDLVGTSWADTLQGGSGKDMLGGGRGADMITGGRGSDRLTGGAGDDTLAGGTGNDRLTGNLGADVFVFLPRDGRDRVSDFGDAGDKIDLRSFDFADFATATSHFTAGLDGATFSMAGALLVLEGVSLTDLTTNDPML